MNNTALIVVDIQNDYFPAGRWPLVGADAAAAQAARAIADARAHGDRVVHVRHESVRDDAPFFSAGSAGAQIHSSVAPLPDEAVVLKHFPNSFRETGLQQRLQAANIQRVTVIGSMSHMCVDATARAASDLGYAVTVLHDACATRDLEFDGVAVPAVQVQAAFMAALASAYVAVVSTSDYLAGRAGTIA